MNPYIPRTGATTDPMAVTNTDAPRSDHANTADHTRRYAAASTGLSFIRSATTRRWRARRNNRHHGTSRVHESIASADPISGSLSASSRSDTLACITVATSAITDESNVHVHMTPILADTTDTGGPNG